MAATNNFDFGNKIDEGGFGPVYKGQLADGTIIAVKQPSSKSKNQLLLVYEYLENNSLSRALFGPKNSHTWKKICVGIARGLVFLHEETRLKTVLETSQEPLLEVKDNINSAYSLSVEAAYINHKDNANKLAKWTAQVILANVELMRLGHVPTVHPRDHFNQVILGVVGYKQWLISWDGLPSFVTWKIFVVLLPQIQYFDPWGQGSSKGGRNCHGGRGRNCHGGRRRARARRRIGGRNARAEPDPKKLEQTQEEVKQPEYTSSISAKEEC
ncbi:cysteine-rich receptor-like protein kinase 36 [Hibiscus syriacus]|uniref:cysteine-rich receptor-like protein kinase 36 n=1 Tax=Hibiscus syriacus TaxID=106335 RepID=UPI0019215705|nr:cysteine-rich receptor-like protein kinase 36 [Hibiscus syriacus]